MRYENREIIRHKPKIRNGGVKMSENRSCHLLQGLFVGALAGVVVGLLSAPKSGKETREELSMKANELAAQIKDEYGSALEKSKTACDSLLVRLKELEARAEKKMKDLKGTSAAS
jgi:gas vesicle protein